ncbi:MAG: hypothetical protein FWD66_06410 [Paludibacter sp.]|nr:hypothetical protein [Paludibacter sp.]
MNKREYPLFLIDRTRSESYPSDYIVCLDREVGFVAQVVHFPKNEMYNAFLRKFENIENNELAGIHTPLKNGGLVLQIIDFLYYFEVKTETKNRVQVLLKKALKKYIHAEINRTPNDDLGIENQIKQQKLTIERTKQNYNDLLQRANGDREIADYQIELAEAMLRTLEIYRDNVIFWDTNLK